MNRSMLVGAVAGIGIATAGAVMAAYAMRADVQPEIAVQTADVVANPAVEPMSAHTAGEAAEAPVVSPPAMAAVTSAQAPVPAVQAQPAKAAATTTASAPAPKSASKVAKPATPVKATQVAQAPAEECWDEEVTHTADPKDDHRIAGTVIGGVVGAAVGNQFGGGSGKTLATVAGAAGGAYAGNRAQKAVQENNTYTTTERRCKPVQ